MTTDIAQPNYKPGAPVPGGTTYVGKGAPMPEKQGCSGCDRCDPAVCPDARENAPPASWQEMVMRLANEENELGAKRQAAYGKDNIPEMGEHGLLVRVVDCVARLRHLVYDPVSGDVVSDQFDDSKVEDVLMDIANFTRYWRAYRRGWWTREFCPPLLPSH